MKDVTNGLNAVRALSPVSVADNTPQVSQTIDLQNAIGVMFTVLVGSVADSDATFAVQLFESDESDMDPETAVTNPDLIQGSISNFQFDSDNTVSKFGYRGSKRYVRVKITPTGNSMAALMAVVAHLEPRKIGTL